MGGFIRNIRDEAGKAAHEKPWVFALYVALRIIVLIVLIRSLFEARYEYALLCLLVLVLLWLLSLIHI